MIMMVGGKGGGYIFVEWRKKMTKQRANVVGLKVVAELRNCCTYPGKGTVT